MSTTPPPPPPPNDPFPPFSNGDGNGGDFNNGDEAGLDQGRPNVAASPGRVMLVVGIVGAVLLLLLYSIFGGSDDDKDKKSTRKETVAPPVSTAPPIPPPLQQPVAPPPTFIPPTVPEPTALPTLRPEDDSAEKERLQARLRSNMLISNNSGGIGASLLGDNSSDPAVDDPNLAFGAAVAKANTKAPRVSATHIGDLRRVIAQGRIIQAVTESAINTELPAPVRAIVSRDVFAEAGTTPLIPKGSRLIGQYNTDLLGGQRRVYLMWTRVIRPDGVDVMIASPLVDRIGQAGIGGQVDSKFQEVFSRAVLASIVTIGVALGSDEVTGGGQTSTTNSAIGGTTQSGDGATTATVNALNRLGSTTDTFLQRYLNLRPSILVDQGTPVNVFVNKDLVFPAEYSGTRVVP